MRQKKRPGYNWKGGFTTRKGYILLWKPNHPNSNKQGYILAHRWTMEQKLGRPLRKDEDVHHINGIITDNRPENLINLSHGLHKKLYGRKDMSQRFCIICYSMDTYMDKKGRSKWHILGSMFMCSRCYHKEKRKTLGGKKTS